MKTHLYLILVLFLVACTHTMAYNDIPPEDFTDTGCTTDHECGCVYCLDAIEGE